VAIISGGTVVDEGTLDSLLQSGGLFVDVELQGASDELREELAARAEEVVDEGNGSLRVTVTEQARVDEMLRLALDRGARVRAVVPRRETLENLFLRRALKSSR
jgi:ABC-2 type transport system ATP-binding protein